ncbi:hypothetical protein UA08_08456 [Talaromyces atroroseus]|uniref:DUF3445 domain-containing protein n=1 Tax=Talaromyces atroroseus TaxID=1441469 RepID=A0A1Q5Q807_TALAT|nr:hypothetical protein UA08_08456 [Talaromyces atroroseus]OKL56284.1 hypothetical protein UA08_08456 [Talaromyces atroroseus]
MLVNLEVGSVLLALLVVATWIQRRRRAEKSASSLAPPIHLDSKQGTTRITPLEHFNVDATEPHPYRPWSSGKFAMTMGIQKVPSEEWLTLDRRYVPEQALRRELLARHHDGVMQILPGSESACEEVLSMVVSYLTQRYPHLFYHPSGQLDHIYNKLTEQTFKIVAPYDVPPLEIAAQLAMEDINILYPGFGEDPEQHYLAASYSMAPAGWDLRERIGWPLWKIHSPVPMWQEKLQRSVEKYFHKMKADDLIARHNYFVQTDDILFQQVPFAERLPEPPKIEDIRIRHERQTLRRLPRTGAILFLVRTYIMPLTDLRDDPDSLRAFLSSVRAMPPNMAKYKGRPVWGETVERWCAEILEEPIS